MLSLAALNPGDKGKILRVQDTASTLKQRLLEMGLIKGASIEVIRFAPLGDPMEIKVQGCRLSLRKKDACAVLVQKEY
jgi:Fe2+ transport system protein FeoA